MDAITTPGAGAAHGAVPAQTVIEVQGLTKRYEKATAVDGITFTVGAGEIFGLL